MFRWRSIIQHGRSAIRKPLSAIRVPETPIAPIRVIGVPSMPIGVIGVIGVPLNTEPRGSA